MNSTPPQIGHRKIEDLIPYARNPRTHTPEQVAQIAAAIIEFGWTNPILIGTDNVIIAGHARLEAARKLDLNDVPVIVLSHLTPTQRRALVVADNRLALNAGWDDAMLRLELEQLREDEFDLDVLGFDDEELEAMLADPDEPGQGLRDEDETPSTPETSVSMAGDVWILGRHRLVCGDATTGSDLDRLMGGETADLVWTDPPYNVDYEGYTEERLTIQGDRMSDGDFRQFLEATFRSYRTVVKSAASLYICHASSCQREFQNAAAARGMSWWICSGVPAPR